MKFMMSTPSVYITSLKQENIEWPVKTFDLLPYTNDKSHWMTGYYSSRPNFKKFVKDSSALYSAQNHLFARKIINQDTTETEVQSILNSTFAMADPLSIVQNSKAISGVSRQYVTNDFSARL
jgi:alpha-mannosidase